MRRDSPSRGLFSLPICFRKEMSSRIDPGIRVKELGGLYINFDGSKSKPVSSSLQKLKEKKIQDEVNKWLIFFPLPFWSRVAEWIMKLIVMWGQVNPITPEMFFPLFRLWPFVSDLWGVNRARWFAVLELLFCCPQVMKKSVIGADFEKKDAVPPYKESKHALKLKHRVSFTKSCFRTQICYCCILMMDCLDLQKHHIKYTVFRFEKC